MPETQIFFLAQDDVNTRETLEKLIRDGWVQDKTFNQGKAIELSGYTNQENKKNLSAVLVYHLMRFTSEEILAQATKKDEKGPVVAFENVPSEKVGEYLKNGWEFMDEKNLVWQKNAHMVQRAKKDQAVQAAPAKPEPEDPCAVCKASGKDCTPENCLLPDQKKPAETRTITEPVVESPPGGGVEIPAITKDMQITRESLELPFKVDAENMVDLGDGLKVDANLAKLSLYPGKELTAEEIAFKERHPKAFEIMQKRIDALKKQKSPELFSPNAGTQSEDRKQ